jgi:ribonuclease Z
MRFLKRLLIGLAGVLIILALVRTVFAQQIGTAMFKQAATSAVRRDVTAKLPDGLHVALIGTGSPLADAGRAGPMTVVIAGQRIFIVDAGGGAVRNFQQFGLPLEAVEGVLLTHFHSDHIDGLGELLLQVWAGGGRSTPLPVHGPQGVAQIVDGLKIVYAQDAAYRVAHHGAGTVDPAGQGGRAVPFDARLGAIRVLDADGLVITAIPVAHAPAEPAVAYRFDYAGRSVTISGDTAKSEALAALARDTDLLVHEALNPELVGIVGGALDAAGRARLAKIMADIPSYHATPVEAAETAAAADAKALVLTHIVPALPSRFLHAAFLKGAHKAYTGPIMIGADGMVFSFPASGGEMQKRRLD